MSGLFGGNAGKDQMAQSNELMRDGIKRLEAVGIPTVEAQKIMLESPELVGLLDAEQMGDTALEQVALDPRLKQSQMRALEEMSGLAETGLSPIETAAFNNLRRQSAAEAQAQNAAVLQQAQERGMLDSGSTLAAQLMAGQQQANRMSSEGDRLAAQAAEARRNALSQQAQMASQIRGQDYGQQTDLARARDTISQFNAQNKQNVAAQNLNARQNIANQGTATRNQQETANKSLIQQNFQNQIQKAGGIANQQNALAGQLANQGQAAAQGQANMWSGLIGTGAQLGAAYLGGPLAGAAVGAATKPQAGSVNSQWDQNQYQAGNYGKAQG